MGDLIRLWESHPAQRGSSGTDSSGVTIAEYLNHWVSAYLANEASSTKRRDYECVIRSHILPAFGGLTFAEFNGVILTQFVRGLTVSGLSTSRIRNILVPLRMIWEDAVEEHRWDLRSPFEYLKRRNRGARVIPRRRRNPPQVFRFAEWTELLRGADPYYRPIMELMVHTGMIATELARLRKEDIQKDRLRVRGTKTEYRDRALPITPPLRSLLEELRGRAPGRSLVTLKSGKPFHPVRFRNVPWKQALQEAELEYRRPYSTRHTFAIWSLISGVHPERLVSLMGHGSKQMVYEVYGRYTEGLEDDLDMIRNYFLGKE